MIIVYNNMSSVKTFKFSLISLYYHCKYYQHYPAYPARRKAEDTAVGQKFARSRPQCYGGKPE